MPDQQVGFIGAGTIARHHAEAIQSVDASIRAVADINHNARQAFAAEYGVADVYSEYEAMLDEIALDAVVVAVPNVLHADCAIAALNADIDVLVEKPLATSRDEASAIADAERDSQATVMVGFCKAFEPWFEDLETRADDGRFGSVYEVEAEYVRRRGIPQLGSWFTQRDVSGGGALIDIGVHVIHQALSVLDFPDIRSVSASTGAHFGSKDEYTYLSMWGGEPRDDATFDVDDHARALIHTKDEATIHIHVAWASNSESRQHLRVYGDEAGATASDGGETAIYATDGDAISTTDLEHPSADHFVEEWRYFIDVLRGDREHTRCTLAEGMTVQEVIDAIYESADQRAPVSVSDR